MEEQALHSCLARMSLEEKVLQLVQVAGGTFSGDGSLETGPAAALGLSGEQGNKVGSVLSLVGAEATEALQNKLAQEQPEPIPLLFMADVINGYRTVFPIPLAQGCSFHPELVRDCAKTAAKEASWAGIHCTFSPMVDLCRDARWGRCMESTGEDVYLNSRMASAMVEGYQGAGLQNPESLAACVKHFAGYGAPTGGREYTGAELSEHTLRQSHLPAYASGVQSGAAMVMSAFNGLDGIPCTGNKKLLTEILREEMGFDGLTISDWGAVEELIKMGVARDGAQAAEEALNAGLDMEMMSGTFAGNLQELVRAGKVSQQRLDQAVYRVLRLKNDLGLFENPNRGRNPEKDTAPMPQAHRELARRMAEESLVLLENRGQLLPLPKQGKKIALIGPYGNTRELNGSWSIFADTQDNQTLTQAMQQAGIAHTYLPGCPMLTPGTCFPGRMAPTREDMTAREQAEMLRQAVEAARQADIVILALGEHMEQSGEAASTARMELPTVQQELLRQVAAVNPNLVTLIFSGRPLVLGEVADTTKALLQCWLPGTEGAAAIRNVLFGDAVPSGKLSMSFPYTAAQEPIWYSDLRNGRMRDAFPSVRYISGYLDCPDVPRYPFGFGLSYTSFSYGTPEILGDLDRDGEITVRCPVTNVGNCTGTEIAQLYVSDQVATVICPARELKGFRRLTLAPGQTAMAEFVLTPGLLSLVDRSGNRVLEPGAFTAWVGGDSRTQNSVEFTCRKGRALSKWCIR